MHVAEHLLTTDQIYDELIGALDRARLFRPVELLRRNFPIGTAAYVVGGFARDCVRTLVEGRPVESKDVDIIIDTNRLANELEKFNGTVSITPLGGFHWVPVGASGWIDVWQLSDTVWIKAKQLPSTIEAFLAGVDLNIDRIAIGLHNHMVIAHECLLGVAHRQIDLDARTKLEELELDELARAVVAHFKTGYALSGRILSSLDNADVIALLKRSSERLAGDGYPPEQIGQVIKFISDRRAAFLAAPTNT